MLQCCYFVIASSLSSFGCLVGYRLSTGEKPWLPRRSYCDYCHQQLRAWQLIPIIGWLVQRGRCSYCHCSISPFLPLTELAAGLAAALLCGSNLLIAAAFLMIITCLVILASSDYFGHFIFPVFLFGLSPLFFLFHPANSLFDLLAALTELLALALLTFGVHGLGSGDFEFLLMTVLTLGWFNTALLTLIACLFSLLFYRSRFIPFMPGLAIGTTIVLVWLKQTGALP